MKVIFFNQLKVVQISCSKINLWQTDEINTMTGKLISKLNIEISNLHKLIKNESLLIFENKYVYYIGTIERAKWVVFWCDS